MIIISSVCLSFLQLIRLCSTDLIVNTLSGQVKGVGQHFLGKSVDAFFGIPYAQPPIGHLRFAKPQPVIPWIGTLFAYRYSSMCIQLPIQFDKQSEDCLYLNIWRPSKPKKNTLLPIMIYFFGGFFQFGSDQFRKPFLGDHIYNGSSLAAIGDQIVVTINYRLGAFGFLYSGTDDAPGNMGLWDQFMAMTWIKDNAVRFGGDPDRILLFGQSAGSISISMHITSPISQNMFQRAILMSGTAYSVQWLVETKQKSLAKTIKMAKSLLCFEPNYVECLRGVEAIEIFAYDIVDICGDKGFFNLFIPIYGDEFCPLNVASALRSGNFAAGKDLIVGNMEDEGTIFILTASICPPDLNFLPIFDVPLTTSFGREKIRRMVEPGLDKLIGDYYLGSAENFYNKEIKIRTRDAIGDYYIACSDVVFAQQYARLSNSRVYFYEFANTPKTSIVPFREVTNWIGPNIHTDDTIYVFGNPFITPRIYSDDDRKLSMQILETWTTFSSTGRPPLQNGVKWSPVSKKNKHIDYIAFDPRGDRMIKNGYPQCNDLFEKLFEVYSRNSDPSTIYEILLDKFSLFNKLYKHNVSAIYVV